MMDESPEDNRFMDYLLFRSLKGTATTAEEEKVCEWRATAPENASYYRELGRLLDVTSQAHGEPAVDVGDPPSALELAGQYKRAGHGDRVDGRPTRLPRSARSADSARTASARKGRAIRWLTAGLGASVAAMLLVFSLQTGPATPADLLSLGVNEFATGVNDVATVQLRDGTILRLAPRSRLRLTGSTNEREVTLDGRAYFAVAKMEGRPFTVKTRGGDAVVLGTRFEAEASGDDLRVLVVEGRVALAASGSRVELGAGEMARAVEGAISAAVHVPDPLLSIEWVGDFLVFQRTPIEDVADDIRQHFDIEVELIGDDLDAHTVTAWFADPTAENVIRVVCKVLAAECTVDPSRATIDFTSPIAARSVLP